MIKHYIFILLCFACCINTMERSAMQSIGWKVQSYAGIDQINEPIVLACLAWADTNKIKFKDKIVIDACSGTGYFTKKVVEKVGSNGFIVGIDTSSSMIEAAQKQYKNIKNLQFYQACVVNYKLSRFPFEKFFNNPENYSLGFDIVTLFNSLEFIAEKEGLCKNIYDCLRPGGYFIANVRIGDEPCEIAALREMIKSKLVRQEILETPGFNELLNQSYVTKEKYKEIIKNVGFSNVIYHEQQTVTLFKSRQDLLNFLLPIAESRDAIQAFCNTKSTNGVIFQSLYDIFITNLELHLEKNEQGNLIYPIKQLFIYACKSGKVNSNKKSTSGKSTSGYDTSLK